MKRLTVLVTDDDASFTRLLRANLEQGEDYRVLEARNGLDCITLVNTEQVDMLVLDVRLPDFNGWGILGLMRCTEALSHIPVIVSSSDPPNAKLMRLLKPEVYVQKPFDIREFVGKVRSLAGPKRGARDGRGLTGDRSSP